MPAAKKSLPAYGRRISLRRWVRLIPGILDAKAAISCAGQLALLPRYEPAVLGATHPAAIVGAPRIYDHGGTCRCTCSQCEDDPGHQTNDVQDAHWDLTENAVVDSIYPPQPTGLGNISSPHKTKPRRKDRASSSHCEARSKPYVSFRTSWSLHPGSM
jgi:hypothetical protein